MTGSVKGPGPIALLLAFAAVYVIWGSTYLAIRFGVETMPPYLMAAARFSLPGLILYVWSRWRGAPRPTPREWRGTAIAGTLLLLAGNGVLTWAEQWVSSSLAALLVATVPLWMTLLPWLGRRSPAPSARGLAGLVAGFAGVGILVGAPVPGGGGARELIGSLSILAASAAWAMGSLYSRTGGLPTSPWMSTAMQMIAGSVSLAIVGTLLGEWSDLDLARVSMRSALSLAYLAVFGSIVAFSAYVWLLRNASPAKVATYAYVNPVVAVILGWWLGDEPIGPRILLAAAIIVAAVVVITTERRR